MLCSHRTHQRLVLLCVKWNHAALDAKVWSFELSCRGSLPNQPFVHIIAGCNPNLVIVVSHAKISSTSVTWQQVAALQFDTVRERVLVFRANCYLPWQHPAPARQCADLHTDRLCRHVYMEIRLKSSFISIWASTSRLVWQCWGFYSQEMLTTCRQHFNTDVQCHDTQWSVNLPLSIVFKCNPNAQRICDVFGVTRELLHFCPCSTLLNPTTIK